ncbi:hypothetical protein DEU37_1500 [Microbacterium sp. AG790]|uniref:hypothetical protein n=1 Tax=Microbacterium sp. AG790 TaxID=2183995 RepID=UPI000EB3FD26|nr:hypothetical protein [Microbacterium sp. AG790]RKS90180.1 hypothetical protein DEU37_1500 [Microbacterium sp. AG790]
MSTARLGTRRLVLASGALIAASALATAAAFVDYADVNVSLDGTRNTFDIRTAGSDSPTWEPTAADWEQGNPTAYEVSLRSGATLAPGGSLAVRIGAQNSSPSLAGLLSLTITDPQPRGNATDPRTGAYLELFDQLVFTVRQGSTVLFDHVPATALQTYRWAEPLPAGDDVVLDVLIELPSAVDNRWQGASTAVLFHFEAENS